MKQAFWVLFLLLIAAVHFGHGELAFDLNRDSLETVEDLSESLANDLLDLSVVTRERDVTQMASFFADQVLATPFPSHRKEERSKTPLVRSFVWDFADAPADLSGKVFLDRLHRFLEGFRSLEDVRFKVKQADFAQSGVGQARVYFFFVGRNQDGQREWTRGYASVEAVRAQADARWQIRKFVLSEIHTSVADIDLFSEVSLPARIGLSIPAFGADGNEGFAWHGAATVDLDQDGDLDIFTTGYNRNYLYLNDGKGHFQETSADAKLRSIPVGVTPLFLDYDNDGDSDLFISTVGEQMLFENRFRPDGHLEFVDVSPEAGVAESAFGFSAIAGDVNQDGWPDIYVASYNAYGRIMPNSWHQATNGTPNLLFINRGDGTFQEVAKEWGVADGRWSYAVQFADLDGDGDQDLYVANDYGENALYLNQGGRFVDAALERGVLDPGNGMGVSFGDHDNDGDLDLHVTNMSSTAGNRILKRLFPESNPHGETLAKLAAGNSLYENTGDGSFWNITKHVGGFSAGWSWGGGFIDFNNDGWEDLYSPNGFISGKSMKDT